MKNSIQHFFKRLISCMFWAFVVFLVLNFVSQVLFRTTPKYSLSETTTELERIRTELPLAEARWKAHGITDYEIEVEGTVHPGACGDYNPQTHIFSPWHLEVEQGEIVFNDDAQKRLVDGPPCRISDFLPPKVFDMIRQKLKNAAPKGEYLKIEFDLEYGFVSDYYLTSNWRTVDTLVQYTFSNFRPKEP